MAQVIFSEDVYNDLADAVSESLGWVEYDKVTYDEIVDETIELVMNPNSPAFQRRLAVDQWLLIMEMTSFDMDYNIFDIIDEEDYGKFVALTLLDEQGCEFDIDYKKFDCKYDYMKESFDDLLLEFNRFINAPNANDVYEEVLQELDEDGKPYTDEEADEIATQCFIEDVQSWVSYGEFGEGLIQAYAPALAVIGTPYDVLGNDLEQYAIELGETVALNY